MKDIINQAHRMNFSNVALAHRIGISVENYKKFKKAYRQTPIKSTMSLRNRLILGRLRRIVKLAKKEV